MEAHLLVTVIECLGAVVIGFRYWGSPLKILLIGTAWIVPMSTIAVLLR